MTLKDFCFDVLGDFVSMDSVIIQNNRVIVLRHGSIPADVIRDEWDRKSKGTEFENISLFI